MSGISGEHIRHLAELAHLRLTAAETERLRAELAGVLGHIDALAELDAGTGDGDSGADAGAAAAAMADRGRDDEPDADPLARGPAALAPGWQDGLFVVPRVTPPDEGEEAG